MSRFCGLMLSGFVAGWPPAICLWALVKLRIMLDEATAVGEDNGPAAIIRPP